MATNRHNHPDRAVFDKVVLAIEHTTHATGADIRGGTTLSDELRLAGRLDRLALAIELEDIFDLELPEQVVCDFGTVGDIVGYLGRRCHDGPAYTR